MWYKFTNHFETRHAGIALAVLLSAALSLPVNAAEIWKVNIAKSKFGSSSNTLVLERDNGKTTTQGVDANGNPTANTFLVISNGKIYLATDEAAYNASSAGIRTVDYTNWRGPNIVRRIDSMRRFNEHEAHAAFDSHRNRHGRRRSFCHMRRNCARNQSTAGGFVAICGRSGDCIRAFDSGSKAERIGAATRKASARRV